MKYGLLGSKLDHSLSPLIHTASANFLGKKITYLSYERTPEQLDQFLKEFWDADGAGLNITFPYKELVAKKLGSRVPSINTLVRDAKAAGWRGESTDGLGFERGLGHVGQNLGRFVQMVLLGNGGAALALARHASERGMQTIKVLRRSSDRDAQWREQKLAADIEFLDLTAEALAAATHGVQGRTLLVQATSAPLHGHDLHQLVPGLTEEFAGMFVDLVYGRVSALFQATKTLGILHQDGLPMLLEQARAAQELWWGESAPYEYLWQLLTRK